MRRKHDETYKLLFSQPRAVEDLVGKCLPLWARHLDFGTLEKLTPEQVGPGLARRHADLLWRIRYRDNERFVVLLLEFQSEIDEHMTSRILEYTALGYRDLLRHGMTVPGGGLPILIAIVIYNGRRRWVGARNMADAIDPPPAGLSEWPVRQRHFVLDLQAADDQTSSGPNVVSFLARLERTPAVETVLQVVEEVLKSYPGARYAELRRAFREWIVGAAEAWGFEESILAEINSLKEAGRMYVAIEEMKKEMHANFERLKEKARRDGFGQGRAEGQATLVCRQARRKFGGATADQLSRLLEDISDPETIARVGDWILDCDDGSELLARVRGM